MKYKRIVVILSMIICFFLGLNFIKGNSDVYSKFSPKTEEEKSDSNNAKTSVGTWNGGSFFETITWDTIGTNESTGKQKVRIRYYITHTGSSYIYQSIAVGIKVDGVEKGTFSSWVTNGSDDSKHISNKTQLCGEMTVELDPGNHTISLYDKQTGGITAVSVSKSFVVPYIVKFVDYDGRVISTQKVESGRNAFPPSNPTRTGYTFTGWNGSYTNVTSNRTITATYKINTYTVKFVDWNGTVLKTQTVNHGSNATPPSNPNRTGYTFTGWKGSYTNVTSNRTITATYKINTYTVKFVDWNGTVLKTQTVNHGSNATPPSNPNRTGYTFTGWKGSYTNVTSNRTITATYKINTYTVKFVDWNGTVLKTQSVNYGSNATPPSNPTRTGYTFTGWSGTYTNVTSNRTITATYKINTYTAITKHWYMKDTTSNAWNPNGTLNSDSSKILHSEANKQIINYGSKYQPKPITITGYELVEDKYANGVTISNNTTVNYYYRKKTYTITFNSNGGSAVPLQTILYKNKASTPKNPTKTGYKFMGWYTEKELKNKFSFSTQITKNISLYAKWDKIPTLKADNMVILEDLYTKEEWLVERLKNATASDMEDGNITNKITVVKDTVDLKKKGTYEITYQVTDSVGNTVKKTITVTVYDGVVPEEKTSKRVRSISSAYLSTLKSKSKWLIRSELNSKLQSTLNAPSVKTTWVLSAEDIESIKAFNNTHGCSKEANQEFLRQFGHLMR